MTVPRRFHIVTFGCQMNVYDSGRLAALLESRGWAEAPSKEDADFIFLNTCSIREKAVQRVLARLRELKPLKKAKPGLVVAVGGCAAEQEGMDLVRQAPIVDIVTGPRRLSEIPSALEGFIPGGPPVVMGGDPPEGENPVALSGAPAGGFPEGGAHLGEYPLSDGGREAARADAAGAPEALRGRRGNGAGKPLILPPCEARGPAPLSAFVTIMEGCDNFCAYCVVPGLRGPERSRPPGDVMAEARSLVGRGAREITLLGQNVNSYRPAEAGRSERGGLAFVRLLEEAAAVPGLWRLRFTTSHPKDFPGELPRLFGTLPKLSPHIHLPLQAGSDRVLRMMGRKYTAAGYMEIVGSLRESAPGASITTDVIVGFPGETEEDFAMTLRIMEEASFDSIFSFKYSDRPGTRAAGMPDKVPEEVKSRRLTEAIALQRGISLKINRALEGTCQELLVTGAGREPGQLSGRTGTNKIVNFDGPSELAGTLARVRITRSGPVSLKGELAAARAPGAGREAAAGPAS
ncbi:MAG: MiaB/RimO family radical SAM methylthiotransferase [Deltaproteobacteria bacterium]|jgi:tRNA-2-methylthio-N6-dimethylallyladenosine synthase|nr:MiaB/RimO family radical SAM methylthiotransferase [Deltaproteobacteria bacterium]